MRKVVLYAPNVHTGGGLVLLKALLASWATGQSRLLAFLDSRVRDVISVPEGCQVFWVMARMASRLKAELDLRTEMNDEDSIVLCFHGLPPILDSKAKIFVFQQNRIYLGVNALSEYSWKTRLKLTIERVIAKKLRHRVTTYIVQTPTMQRDLTAWLKSDKRLTKCANVRLLPFMDEQPFMNLRSDSDVRWDFVYIADGVAHKNHRLLLEAWKLLAEEGIRPSLALTLTPRDASLRQKVEQESRTHNLAIVNLGHLPYEGVIALYKSARALIFPSITESFGLPLLEASRLGLPIVAGELDFVRDVCEPCQTFDARSAVSIARAVKRFLGLPEAQVIPCAPSDFWHALLSESCSKRA